MSTLVEWYGGQLPEWLGDPTSQQFFRALLDSGDELGEKARDAVRNRMPLLAHPTSLTAIGRDRQIERMVGESAASYAARLDAAA